MTEAPDHIFLLPKDAALFGQKYGHPDVQQAHVGDESVQYIRKDVADLARPVTVAEAAKDSEISRLKSLLGRYADHVAAEEGTDFLDCVHTADCITEAEGLEIRSYSPDLRALSHEGGE